MATPGSRSVQICTMSFLFIFVYISTMSAQQKPATAVISSVDKSLQSDSILSRNMVNENVNTGYGTQKENEITNSIVRVGSNEFNKGNINSPWQLIQGKVAGLDISKPGGDPNGSYYLRLRGLNTIYGNTQPLVVIDGIIDASINNIDPNDIESITVLKDGSAAAIYGTRGANGVILVTTKQGKKGKTQIEYNVYTSAEMVAKNEPVMSAAEWRMLSSEIGLGTDLGTTTDWYKEIEQTAFSQSHNLSISGGTDQTSYRASINYRQGQGVEIRTGYDQLNGRISITQKAIHDKLTLDLNMGATDRQSKYGFSEAFRYAAISNPTAPVRSDDPAFAKYNGYYQQVLFDYYNPVAILQLNKNEGKNRILNMSLKGTYEILKGLAIDALYSIQNSNDLTGIYYSKVDYWGGINRNGLASRTEDSYATRLFESTLHYSGDLNSSLNINAFAGYSYQDYTNEGFYAQGGNFLTDDFSYNNLSAALDFKNGKGDISSYKNSNKLIGFFGRIDLNINNIWFISASARNEGSSRFGANNKWGLFPSVGGGIDLTRALNIKFMDHLKFRMAYGITGNQPAESYMSLQKLGPQGSIYFNGNFDPMFSVVNNANANLKWEEKKEFNMGLDFSLLNSKLTGSWDFYTNTSNDLLYQYQVPVPPNLYNYAWINIGKIKSSGLELTLNYNVIDKPDFTYKITLTRSHKLKNILVSLSGKYNGADLSFGTVDNGDLGSPGGCCTVLVRTEEGKPIGQLISYVDKGIDETGRYILVDQNNDGQITWTDRVVNGNGLPKTLNGLDNMLTYKNWDVDVFFRGVFGHNIVNSYLAMYEIPSYISAYNLPRDTKEMRNPATGQLLINTGGVMTKRFIEKASFISLDNLSAGYNFSLHENSQFSKIRIYIAANNLFYITRYKGPDPNPRYSDHEFSLVDSPLLPGIDRRNTWPRTRSFIFGANIIFK
jgi:TonB-dependent starch-binding outer membrane protein SusC